MKKLWNIEDLIDLHFFSNLDEEVRRKDGEVALAKRDRIIYLAKIEPKLGKVDDIPPRILVRKWLAIRAVCSTGRRGHEGLLLPGTVWQELTLLCQGLIFFCGLFSGLGLAGSLLLYSGTTPLNVSVYFGLFVFFQLVLLGLQSLFLCYRRLRRIPMESSVIYVLIGRLLMRGLDCIRRWVQRKMTGHQRLDLAALVGGVRQRKELAALLIWPAFILVQLGGIGFNIGVIGATLAKVTFSDIAFAWQSSLRLSAELVAGLVQWIALPWSWAVSPGLSELSADPGQPNGAEGRRQSIWLPPTWWPGGLFSAALSWFTASCPAASCWCWVWCNSGEPWSNCISLPSGIRPLLRRMTAPGLTPTGSGKPHDPK